MQSLCTLWRVARSPKLEFVRVPLPACYARQSFSPKMTWHESVPQHLFVVNWVGCTEFTSVISQSNCFRAEINEFFSHLVFRAVNRTDPLISSPSVTATCNGEKTHFHWLALCFRFEKFEFELVDVHCSGRGCRILWQVINKYVQVLTSGHDAIIIISHSVDHMNYLSLSIIQYRNIFPFHPGVMLSWKSFDSIFPVKIWIFKQTHLLMSSDGNSTSSDICVVFFVSPGDISRHRSTIFEHQLRIHWPTKQKCRPEKDFSAEQNREKTCSNACNVRIGVGRVHRWIYKNIERSY